LNILVGFKRSGSGSCRGQGKKAAVAVAGGSKKVTNFNPTLKSKSFRSNTTANATF